jgi:hypothetical protein
MDITNDDVRQAIREAQRILRTATPDLIMDGRWGSYTQAAYDRAAGPDRVAVDAVLATANATPAALIAENRRAKSVGDTNYQQVKQRARVYRSRSVDPQTIAESEAALREAATRTGLDYNVLRGFAVIESNLDHQAQAGSSRGLMQIQPAAWQDIQQLDPSVGSYNAGVFDAKTNAYVGARYLKLNERRLKKMGFTDPITPAVLYLAHQQGAGGFMELWRTANGLPVRTNYVSIEKMRKNPPQDGQGVTTDKAEFHRRWLAVAERKIGSR